MSFIRFPNYNFILLFDNNNLQSFFVIEIQQEFNVGPLKDLESNVQCDLMEGRDPFLTLARERHLEFSSLRRAKYSTMALAYELHNQGHDKFIYTCNYCSRHVESRYHCNTCEVSLWYSIKLSISLYYHHKDYDLISQYTYIHIAPFYIYCFEQTV